MNVSQRQMQAFLDIARLRSFTRAAERLHITQSGLSAMMRDLESQMNCRLFDRTTRSVSLTAEGLQLVPVASRILAELDSVSDAITQISTRARKIWTVGVAPVIAANGSDHLVGVTRTGVVTPPCRDEFLHGQFLRESRFLQDNPDTPAQCVAVGRRRQAEHLDGPGGWLSVALEDVDSRGLASSVWP